MIAVSARFLRTVLALLVLVTASACVSRSVDECERLTVDDAIIRPSVAGGATLDTLVLTVRDTAERPVAGVGANVELSGAGPGTKVNNLSSDQDGEVVVDLAKEASFLRIPVDSLRRYRIQLISFGPVNGVAYCTFVSFEGVIPTAPSR